MVLNLKKLEVLFFMLLIFCAFGLSVSAAQDEKDLCYKQKYSAEPNTYCTFSHMDYWGPYLLARFADGIEGNFKLLDKYPAIYRQLIAEQHFIEEQEHNDNIFNVNPRDALDYSATNWSWGPFPEDRLQNKVIDSLIKQELIKAALSKLLDQFIEQMDFWYPNQFLSTRHVETPIVQAFLGGKSTFGQFYIFQKKMKCVEIEEACQKRKREYQIINSKILSTFRSELEKTIERIDNYQPRPWREAQDLQTIFKLNQIFQKIKNLKLEELIYLIENFDQTSKKNEMVNLYRKAIKEIVSKPKNLSETDSIQLYRDIAELAELQSIFSDIPNQIVFKGQTNDSKIAEFSNQIENHIQQVINQIGYFYQERENEIQ